MVGICKMSKKTHLHMPAVDMVDCKECKNPHVAMLATHERVFPAGNISSIEKVYTQK